MHQQNLTERQKQLLTLLVDKINNHGYMMGAHLDKNWLTHPTYESGGFMMQGTLDRIGRVEYHQSFHIDEENYDFLNPRRLGPDLYDHSMRFYWRELFGKGYGKNPAKCLLSSMTQDKAGRWHMPVDDGIWISLWHPNMQNPDTFPDQERVDGCWNFKDAPKYPHWRPVYHFTREEVIEALRIMCETFDWQFKDCGQTEPMIIY